MAILVPCLDALRAEFNLVSPGRDKRSDGWIGDRAHAMNSSDHNGDESGNTPHEDADNDDEVHGLDVDHTGSWPDKDWFGDKIGLIVHNHRTGKDNRLQNVIYKGRIASRSWGWEWRKYNGSNGHYEHAHFSARYTSAQERDVSPWGVYEAPKPIQEAIMALEKDMVTITADTAKVIGKNAGDEVPASTLLMLSVIYSGRVAKDLANLHAKLDEINAKVTPSTES
jgi:hypothetical protein